jgi:hypothetical protein
MFVRNPVRLAMQVHIQGGRGLKCASGLCFLGRAIHEPSANLPKISRHESGRSTDRPFEPPALAIELRTDGGRSHTTRVRIEVI